MKVEGSDSTKDVGVASSAISGEEGSLVCGRFA